MKHRTKPGSHPITASFFLLVGGLLTLALPARALTINVTYDSSVTNIGTLSQVQTAFGAADQTIQSLYTNAITINIGVYGPNAGHFGSISLGQSYFSLTGNFTYSQIVSALRNRKIPVEYMLVENEGHGVTRRENIVAYLGRSYRFLAGVWKIEIRAATGP